MTSLLFPAGATALLVVIEFAVRRLRGRGLSSVPQAAVWAAVLSTILWTGVERLNVARPLWTNLGWPTEEFARYLAQGWLHATVLPSLLLLTDLFGGFPLRAPVERPRRWGSAGAAAGVAVVGAALFDRIPGPAELWLPLGLIGIWAAADGWSLARGAPSVIGSSAPQFSAIEGAAIIWGLSAAALSHASAAALSAERYWTAGDGWAVSTAVYALAGVAVLAAYRAATTIFGLPAYPEEDPAEDPIKTLGLS